MADHPNRARRSVRVRMYRGGLGDRFLLGLARPEGRPFWMLIDCGDRGDTAGSRDRMKRVARDVAETTGGHLDVVVVSHAHWDHVSGFVQAAEVFATMAIDEIWLPWTEDMTDPEAKRLCDGRLRSVDNLRVAANRLEESDPGASERIRRVLDLLGPSRTRDARRAIESLLGHPGRPRVRFLAAGDAPPELDGCEGAVAYVLAPGRPGPGGREAGAAPYDHSAGQMFFASLGRAPADPARAVDLNQTFAPRYRLSREQAEGSPFFRDHYLRTRDDWRRIDAAWLYTAEPFALALSQDTSDTSLALAIELEPDGRVLLFPGDAQGDRWPAWSPAGRKAGTAVSAADLLARTVLYKASHHGSPTGTPVGRGLDLMTSPDLVVMVPVDGEAAADLGWDLPSPVLLDRLRQRARGRVLRSDQGLPARPAEVDDANWTAFVRSVEISRSDLYVEYRMADRSMGRSPDR